MLGSLGDARFCGSYLSNCIVSSRLLGSFPRYTRWDHHGAAHHNIAFPSSVMRGGGEIEPTAQ